MQPNQEQHLAAIRAALTTDDEREFFDRAAARFRDQSEGELAHLNRQAGAHVVTLTVDEAVAALRREMPSPTLKPFLCDDPNSLTDRDGYDLGGGDVLCRR